LPQPLTSKNYRAGELLVGAEQSPTKRAAERRGAGQLEGTDLGRRRLDLDLNGIFDGLQI
jgi:hypothetical protein